MYQILNASFPIIIAYVQLIFGLMLGPVFICLYLFKTTEHMFKNWLSFLCARVANIVFVVLILSTFASIIKKQFNALLNFPVRTTELFPLIFPGAEWFFSLLSIQINWDVKVYVPDFSGTYAGHFATFFTTIMHLILIFVLIFMFGKLAKMIPSIADSMISIGDGDGGKMGKIIGNSTFTESADKSFKSFFDTNKGMLKTVKRIGGDFTAPVRGFLDNKVWTRMKNGVSNLYYKKDKAWESTTNGMTSKQAIDAITNNYADTLDHKWFRKRGTMNKKISEFREDVQKHFLIIEANNLRDKLLNNKEIMSRYGDLLKNQAVINRLIQNQIGMNLGKYDTGKYDTYLSKIANIKGTNDIDYDEEKFKELQHYFGILNDTNYLPRLQTKYEELKNKEYSDRIRDTFNILYNSDNPDDLLKDKRTAESLTNVVKELREAANTLEEFKKYGFLMKGIDINTFGTGANMSNFCMSGIGNDFLGFNGGALAITSGMGIELTNDEKSKNIIESIKPFIFYEYKKLKEQDHKVSEAALNKSDKDLKEKRQRLKELKEQKKKVTYEPRKTNDDKLKQEVSQLSAEIEAQRKDEEEATKTFIIQNRRNLKNINDVEELIKLELKQLTDKTEKEEREKRLEELKEKKNKMAERLKESLKESEEETTNIEEKLQKSNKRISELSENTKKALKKALTLTSTSVSQENKNRLFGLNTGLSELGSISGAITPEKKEELLRKNVKKLKRRLTVLNDRLQTAATLVPTPSSATLPSTSTSTTTTSSASTSTSSSTPAVASATPIATPTPQELVRKEIENLSAELTELKIELNKSKTNIEKELERQKIINSIISDIETPDLPSMETSSSSTAPTASSTPSETSTSATTSTSSAPSSSATPTSTSATSPVLPTTSSVSPSTATLTTLPMPTSPNSTTSSATSGS